MDEAERLCDRVAVVDHGKVIALGTPTQLIARLGGEHLVEFAVENDASVTEEKLAALPAVVKVRRDHERFCLAVSAPHVAIPALLQCLETAHVPLMSLTTRHASLEDVFVTLTGRHLRDEG